MPDTATDVATIPSLDRAEARRLAKDEYDRFGDLLHDLSPSDWETHVPDCPAWNVRQLVCHVVGGMEANASMRENLGQLRRARKRPEVLPDALSAIQGEDRVELSPDELMARYDAVKERAVRGRFRVPGPMRRVRFAAGWGGEKWRLGFLLDSIYTRDTWMHRVDVSRATGRELVLGADHDGRIVADAVADWAGRHEEPFELVLDGPAGGHWRRGEGGEELRLDAVEFCRVVSGRGEPSGLLSTEVPF